jgi:glyoxylase-like metal-dependent hydrolase (beta-lactamase superfamily II)
MRQIIGCAVALLIVACGGEPPRPLAPTTSLPPVSVERLAPDVWMHTSYKFVPEFGSVLSHGLVVRVAGAVYLIDTAWTDVQTVEVLAWVSEHLAAPVAAAVVTHAHEDKMGGMKALHDRGVATYAIGLTNRAALERHLEPAVHELALTANARALANGAIEVFYPGAGHTRDNVVVYLNESRVLFGGCLIRPGDSDTMGNTADGSVPEWDDAVIAVKARYPHAAVVVPSHGAPGSTALLDHTIALAQRAESSP